MSKIIDITNKLNFEEKPKILVKGTEIEVNNDAISFIKAIALFDSENGVSSSDLLSALELLFDEENREKIAKLHLSQNFISRLPTSQLLLRQQPSLSPTMTARGKFRPRLRLNR